MILYKTIIVEDEGPARRRLAKMVADHPALELISSLKSGEEAISKIPLHQPDVLLLDIQLKDKTAFEVLEKIKTSIDSKIVFITAFDSYAIKAFEIEAVDYLLKPYDQERFNVAIARILKKDKVSFNNQFLQILKESINNQKSKISILEGNKNHLFFNDEIIYIQSDRYYVHVFTKTEKRLIRVSLKMLESTLPKDFIRINKSTIINTQFISKYDRQKSKSRVTLISGMDFHVSSTYNSRLAEKLF